MISAHFQGKPFNITAIQVYAPKHLPQRAKANWIFPGELTGHKKHPLQPTQEMTVHMNITIWSKPKSNRLYSLQPKIEKLFTVSKIKTRRWLQLWSWTLYYKIQTKLKKVEKTMRPFMYDLNQIPYDCIVEGTNRFKGLDVIDRVPEELWTEVHDIV